MKIWYFFFSCIFLLNIFSAVHKLVFVGFLIKLNFIENFKSLVLFKITFNLIQVEQYFSCLPHEKVPHFNNPDGIKYHNKQLILQIPLQDSNIESLTSLAPKEKYLLDAFKRERDPEISVGKVVQAKESLVRVCFKLCICQVLYTLKLNF